jgi:kynurenine formamidase
MPVIDISGPIREGMRYYGEPYLDMPVPPVRVHEVDFPPKYAGRIFTQVVEMCVQTGSYLETASHAIKGREDIDEVPLQRSWMVPTVVIHDQEVHVEQAEHQQEAQHDHGQCGGHAEVEQLEALLVEPGGQDVRAVHRAATGHHEDDRGHQGRDVVGIEQVEWSQTTFDAIIHGGELMAVPEPMEPPTE